MAFETDRILSQLCDERDDVRIRLSLAGEAVRSDARDLLTGRARLILLEAEIGARRRILGRAQPIQVSPAAPPAR
jgi:hypothetical protein